MTDRNTIEKLFESFEGKRVLIIGDVMIDSYLWGKVERISPEAPVPVVELKKRENRLGGAANVALNIQSLGAVPVLCSVIGKEEKSNLFLDLLQKQKMTTEGIICSEQRITTVKFRIIGNNMQMLRVDEENHEPLKQNDTQNLIQLINQIIEQTNVSAIIFEDYDKGVITRTLIDEVVATAAKKQIPVVVDPKKRNFLQYNNVSLFKPNLKELREGLKLDDELETPGGIEQSLKYLQDKLNIGITLTTLSEKGIFFSEKDLGTGTYSTGLIPAHVRNISDVSGAGDTVISVAALCMAAKAETPLMACLANLAGGIVCEHVGVVPVDKERLLSEALTKFCY
jgi:D-glycero-beta-D-manno-heptose-7-phosphate kinase